MKKHHLTCSCADLEHQIWFSYFDDEEDKEMYISMHHPSVNFWSRLKHSIKYLLNKDRGQFTDIVVYEKDIENLEDFLCEYRNGV